MSESNSIRSSNFSLNTEQLFKIRDKLLIEQKEKQKYNKLLKLK